MGRDGQVSALALFSEELRRARAAAGLTQDQLADRVGYSPSLVAHVETGSRAPSLDFARRGDEALATGGLLARLQPFVRSEAYPAWFRDWVEIEREAVSLRWFEPLLIPGLLQTEEYARAVLAAAHPASPGDEVDRPGGVAVRHTEGRGAVPARLDRPGEEGDRQMDLTGAPWRKSSYSGGNGGACVEVAVVPGSKEGSDYVITMRDSKDPDGPVLTFTPDEWQAFTLGVQDGEFDVEDDSPAESAPDSAGS